MKRLLFSLLLLTLSQVCHAGIAEVASSNHYSYSLYTAPGTITGHPGIPFFNDSINGGLLAFSHNNTTGTLTSTDLSYSFSQSLTNNVTATLAADGTYSATLHEVNNFTGTQATATAYVNLINSNFAGQSPTSSFFQGFQLTTDVPQQYRIQGTDSQVGSSPTEMLTINQDGSFFAGIGTGSIDQTVTLLPGHTYAIQVFSNANNDAFTGRNDGIFNVSTDMSFSMTPGAVVPEPSTMTLLALSALAVFRRRRESRVRTADR
jgi:hypothetical protein